MRLEAIINVSRLNIRRAAWWLRLAVMALAALALLGVRATPAAADEVEIEHQVTLGTLTVLPGDWIAGGYILRVPRAHPELEVVIEEPRVFFWVRCPGTGQTARITIPLDPFLERRGYEISEDDTAWRPANDDTIGFGYQGATRAPAVCGAGRPMIHDAQAGGAEFKADVAASNPRVSIEIKFHVTVPRAQGRDNRNCANLAENPAPGSAACASKWGPSRVVRGDPIEEEGDDVTILPQVNGYVFKDLDGDGVREPGEPGLGSVGINIYDKNTGQLVASAVSLPEIALPGFTYGGYFVALVPAPGWYTVREVELPGYVDTTPNQVDVFVPQDGAASVDFGERAP